MIVTQTHTLSLDPSFLAPSHPYYSIFTEFVYEEIEMWREFHAHWIHACATNGVPLHVVKYEDLVGDEETRRKTLVGVSSYVFSSKGGLPVKELEKRIDEATLASSVYRPKKNQINALDLYSFELKRNVLLRLRSLLIRFKYFSDDDELWSAHFVPKHVVPGLGSLLVADDVDDDEGERTSRARQPRIVINKYRGLRPKTKDDPHARGFGVRWKRQLSELPPPKVIDKTKGD